MNEVEELTKTIELLADSYEKICARFAKDFPGVDPALITDPQGRFVLLDAIIAITNAKTALVNARRH